MRKITISLEEAVYEGLQDVVGKGNISRFLNDLARPHVVHEELVSAYQDMASDHEREAQAKEWIETLVGDAVGEEG